MFFLESISWWSGGLIEAYVPDRVAIALTRSCLATSPSTIAFRCAIIRVCVGEKRASASQTVRGRVCLFDNRITP